MILRQNGLAFGYAGVLAACAALAWASRVHPAEMPAWAPWDFSPVAFVAVALAVLWYGRGIARAPRAVRPPVWRIVCLALGLLTIWAVLQTRFEYWSQHMFFINRIQHVAMHHLGPMLIALAAPGAVIRRGMPRIAARLAGARPVTATLSVVQHPVLAPVLFVGLFWFWLIPGVHFRAMIDPELYAVMNWSMIVDGLLFWSLVLDPRPAPPARVSYLVRAALAIGVMFPQIVFGALITFSPYDLYPYYSYCGRLLASMSAIEDQQIGGIVIWIPPGMMSVAALVLVVNSLRLHDAGKETVHEQVFRGG